MSETATTIYAQLARAQAQFKPALKDSQNPHFKSSYADMASIWEACREGLAAQELFVSQPIVGTENGWHVHTKVYNAAGDCIEAQMPIISDMRNPQTFGSALTYARRYSLAAILGIVTDDDDGEAAMNRQGQKQAKPAPQPEPVPQPETPPVRMATTRQKAEILLLLNNDVITKEEKEKMTESLNKMDTDRADKAIGKLNKIIAQRQGATGPRKEDVA